MSTDRAGHDDVGVERRIGDAAWLSRPTRRRCGSARAGRRGRHRTTTSRCCSPRLDAAPTARCVSGCRFIGLEQRGESASGRRWSTPSPASRQVDARYVIGADGAHSAVRRARNPRWRARTTSPTTSVWSSWRSSTRQSATGVMRCTCSSTPTSAGAVLARRGARIGGACRGSGRTARREWTPRRRCRLLALIRAATGVADLDVARRTAEQVHLRRPDRRAVPRGYVPARR